MNSEVGLFARCNELIGSAVRVESKDLTFTTGVLYCIDPESDSVVLLCVQEGSTKGEKKWSVKILLGHSVVAIHADNQAGGGETLESIHQCLSASQEAKHNDREGSEDSGALLRRRQQLGAFLRQRFIPCEENDSDSATASVVVFGGAARVLAPFTCESIECANEQILARLQQLLVQFEGE